MQSSPVLETEFQPRSVLAGSVESPSPSRASALPSNLQEAIAETIFASLREEANPSSKRFQELVDVKYTRGLTPAESSEMRRLEAGFRDADEAFYAQILDRVKAQTSTVKKRSAS